MGAFETMLDTCREQLVAIFPPEALLNSSSINYFCHTLANVAIENHHATGVLDFEEIVPLKRAWWISGLTFTVIMALTVVLNLLSLYIFLSASMRSPTNVLLAVITLFDLLTCVLQTPVNNHAYLQEGYRELPTYIWCDIYNYVHNFLPSAFHSAAFLLNMYLSVQRCVGVKRVRHCQILGTYRGTIVAIVSCAVISFAIHSMYPISIGVNEVQAISKKIVSPTGLQFVTSCRVSPRNPEIYDQLFSAYLWLRVALLQTLPALVLSICNIILIRVSYRAYTYRRRLVGSVGTIAALSSNFVLDERWQPRGSSRTVGNFLRRKQSQDNDSIDVRQTRDHHNHVHLRNSAVEPKTTQEESPKISNGSATFYICPDDRLTESAELNRGDCLSSNNVGVSRILDRASDDTTNSSAVADVVGDAGASSTNETVETLHSSSDISTISYLKSNNLLSDKEDHLAIDCRKGDMVYSHDLGNNHHGLEILSVQAWSDLEKIESDTYEDSGLTHTNSNGSIQVGARSNDKEPVCPSISDVGGRRLDENVTWWDFLQEPITIEDVLHHVYQPAHEMKTKCEGGKADELHLFNQCLQPSVTGHEEQRHNTDESVDQIQVSTQLKQLPLVDDIVHQGTHEQIHGVKGVRNGDSVSSQSHQLPMELDTISVPGASSLTSAENLDLFMVTGSNSSSLRYVRQKTVVPGQDLIGNKDTDHELSNIASINRPVVKDSVSRQNSGQDSQLQRRKSSQTSNYNFRRNRSIASQTSRKSSINRTNTELRSTVMLILVTSCTLIAEVFVIILLIFKFINTVRSPSNQFMHHPDLASLIMISNIVTILTFPLNFVFFCGLSQGFRATLRDKLKMITKCFHRRSRVNNKTFD